LNRQKAFPLQASTSSLPGSISRMAIRWRTRTSNKGVPFTLSLPSCLVLSVRKIITRVRADVSQVMFLKQLAEISVWYVLLYELFEFILCTESGKCFQFGCFLLCLMVHSQFGNVKEANSIKF
jgi:hypothetical protein